MDNKELIARARELAGKASKGPWLITVPENEVTGYTHGAIIWSEATASETPGWVSDGINIGEVAPTDDDYSDVGHGIDQNSNGIFIAASRALVPELADALEAALDRSNGLVFENGALNIHLKQAQFQLSAALAREQAYRDALEGARRIAKEYRAFGLDGFEDEQVAIDTALAEKP